MPRREMLRRMTEAGDDLMEWFAALEVLNEDVRIAADADPVRWTTAQTAPAAPQKEPVALRVKSAFDVLVQQQKERRAAGA